MEGTSLEWLSIITTTTPQIISEQMMILEFAPLRY